MKQAARVTSLEALARFRAAWAEFGEETRLALSNAENDVQRTLWWLQNDARQHWQQQIKRREKVLAEAKAELHSAKLSSSDVRPSLVLERKRVEKAERLLEEARQKLERVRQWSRVLEREFLLYKGQTQALAGRVERDGPKGLARLANLMDHLEKYVRTAPPTAAGSTPTGGDAAEDAGEGGEDKGADE